MQLDTTALQNLIARIGAEHVERRLKIEIEREAQLFGQGLIFFNLENWYSAPWIIRNALKLTGLYDRARRNADKVIVRRNTIALTKLPPAFDNFTILHLTDLHIDLSEGAMRHLISIVHDMQYDICVLTGDYRGKTYGPFEKSLKGVNELRAQLKGPLFGVLGNHDSIYMAPSLEAMGIRMLFNECETIVRGDQQIFLAGVDDPHFTGPRTSRKRHFEFLKMPFRFYYRIRRKFTVARRVRDLMSCSAGIRMAVSYAYPVAYRSSWKRDCLEQWAPAPGVTLTWLVTPR